MSATESRIRWDSLAKQYGLSVEHWGLASLAGFSIKSENSIAYKTLITQEMLAKGFLASNCVYVCTEHTNSIIDQYFEALEPVFELIKECEDGREVQSLLESPLCETGFKRLN